MRGAQPVLGGDVHRQQLSATGSNRDPGTASQQGFAFPTPCQGDDYPFTGFPTGVDTVLATVVGQRVIDLVGHPQQGQLTQGGEIAEPEVV